jgi:hypothetical protein
MARLLLEKGARVDEPDASAIFPMHSLIMSFSTAHFRFLFSKHL